MSSTNKTTNYELSQFVGSDKPTWLGDYNSDMGKIDTQMKANATAVTNAQSTATTASETATTANTTANTANNTANTASTTATTALNKALANEAEIAKLNLTSFTSIANNDITITGGRTVGANSLQVATNTDGSIGKIYGRLSLSGSGSGNVSFPSALRPDEEITINGLAIRDVRTSNGQTNLNFVSVTIGTNGVVTFPYSWADSASNPIQFLFVACLLFMKNFGDAPENP